jgi:hypothetical protein
MISTLNDVQVYRVLAAMIDWSSQSDLKIAGMKIESANRERSNSRCLMERRISRGKRFAGAYMYAEAVGQARMKRLEHSERSPGNEALTWSERLGT